MSKHEELRTALARYYHDQAWAGWMKYQFGLMYPEMGPYSKDHPNVKVTTGNLVLMKELVERWDRQMNTPFDQLSEKEQKSDYDEADKIIAVLREMNKDE